MNKLFRFTILFLLILSSCDILRSSLFEVTFWSPNEGYHSEPEEIVISMGFSREPDKDSVERRFTLNDDNGRVKGTFFWEGNKVTFFPLTPLEKNMDYTLNLSADAHDTKGLSMDFPFENNFTTRAGTERPIIISYYPPLYGEIDDTKTEIILEFSLPIPLNTLYENVSFVPSMTGTWRLENSEKLAVFTPAEPWTMNRRYEIRYSSSLEDNNGMGIRNSFTSVFSMGTDWEEPFLLRGGRMTKNGDIIPLDIDTSGYIGAMESLSENSGWEKDDKLFFEFSKPVDSVSVRNNINVEDAPSIVMETSPGFKTEFIFCFETVPVFESRFVFRLKPGIKDSAGNESKDEYIYRIFANGEASRPPSLAGIRMPMAPLSSTDLELVSFDNNSSFEIIPIDDFINYPSTVSVRTWIELYFITAEGASIDAFSVMDRFRIETSNNVLNFSPRQIKNANFSVPEPAAGWEEYTRIEVAGFLTNSTNFGVVNFQIASGLKDSLGNINENLQRISLIK